MAPWLISQINKIGIEAQFLEHFKFNLSNRQQIVIVDAIQSNMSHLSADIPQGSKLALILFIIYQNYITEDLESGILIVADDCSLLASADDSAQSTIILNRDLEQITNGL